MRNSTPFTDPPDYYRVVKWKGATFRRWRCVYRGTGYELYIWHITAEDASRMAARYIACEPDQVDTELSPLVVTLAQYREPEERKAKPKLRGRKVKAIA